MKRLNDDETVLLISFVQGRECLWNESNADFKRISITKKLWNEIGGQLNISGEEARSKWKNLKDKFKKLLNRMAQDELSSAACGQVAMPQWKFYEAMLFMKEVLVQQNQQSSGSNNISGVPTASGSADPETIDEEYFQEYNFDFLVKRTPDRGTDRSEPPAAGQRGKAKKNNNPHQRAPEGPSKRKIVDEEQQNEQQEDKEEPGEQSAVRIQRRKSEDDYYFLMSLLPYIRTLNPIEKLELRSKMQNLVTDSYKKHDTLNKRPRMNHN